MKFLSDFSIFSMPPHKIPYWTPVFMGFGILFYFSLPVTPPWSWSLFTLFVALAAALSGLRGKAGFSFWLTLFALGLGFSAAQFEEARTQTTLLSAPLKSLPYEGQLIEVEPLPLGTRLTLKPAFFPRKNILFEGSALRIKVNAPLDQIPPLGTWVAGRGPVWPPNDPVYPGGYPYRFRSFFEGLGGTGYAYRELRLKQKQEGFAPNRVRFFFEKMRRGLMEKAITLLPADKTPLLTALLTGSKTALPEQDSEALRAAGLSHLLSISGFHVGLVAFLLFVPLRALLALWPWFALRFPIKKIAATFGCFGTAAYTLLVGAGTPTMRAALMTGFVLFALLLDRKILSLRLVMLVAALLLLVQPHTLFFPSFQMSFAAVIVLVAFYEKRAFSKTEKAGVFSRGFSFFKNIALTSLLATLATTPFALFHFQTFSFYGVLSNMLAIPLMAFWIMPALLIGCALLPFGFGLFFWKLAGEGAEILLALAHKVSSLPYAQSFMPPMPVWALACATLGLLTLCLLKGKPRLAGLLPLFIAALFPFFSPLPDLVVEENLQAFAFRTAPHRAAFFEEKQNAFLRDQWQHYLAMPESHLYTPENLPEMKDVLSCQKAFCALRKDKVQVIFIRKEAKKKDMTRACATAPTLLITPLPAPKTCAAKQILSAQDFKENGAHAFFFEEGKISIQTVRDGKSHRPWGW